MSRRPFLPPLLASPPGTNLGSRVLGDLCHRSVPQPLLAAMIRLYARHTGANLEESAVAPEACGTFAEFFTRRLRPGVRPVDRSNGTVVSPVDGRIQAFDRLDEGGRFDQVKGHAYSVEEFLGGPEEAGSFRRGWYAVLYLSPGDYHRIHCPVDGTLRSWKHIPGTLVSVQPFFCNLVAGLLVSNERVLSRIETRRGPVVTGMVGACGVGRIRLAHDDLETNRGNRRGAERILDPMVSVRRGDELGLFDLGSTVVLLLADEALKPVPELVSGQPVRMGMALFRRS
ncbi:MAG: phosphatidylserine decarboxylase [Deltaproteobacteria bacterium]|nr:phosphatidylserine decarboxylase [Deltaproteobacteria bacterium]